MLATGVAREPRGDAGRAKRVVIEKGFPILASLTSQGISNTRFASLKNPLGLRSQTMDISHEGAGDQEQSVVAAVDGDTKERRSRTTSTREGFRKLYHMQFYKTRCNESAGRQTGRQADRGHLCLHGIRVCTCWWRVGMCCAWVCTVDGCSLCRWYKLGKCSLGPNCRYVRMQMRKGQVRSGSGQLLREPRTHAST